MADCRRYDHFLDEITDQDLADRALEFAREYRRLLLLQYSDQALEQALVNSIQELRSEVELLRYVLSQTRQDCYDDFQSKTMVTYDGKLENVEDVTKDGATRYDGIADVAVVLDASIVEPDDVAYMRQVVSALTLEINMWTTSVTDSHGQSLMLEMGSRLEVSEGRFGRVQHPSQSGQNPGVLACQIWADSWDKPSGGDSDPATALSAAAARMAERRFTDLESGLALGKAQVVILFLFGRVSQKQHRELHRVIWKLANVNPELRVMIVTRWAPHYGFQTLVSQPDHDILTLNKWSSESNAVLDAKRIADRLKTFPGQMSFPSCSGSNYHEGSSRLDVYLSPGTRRLLVLQPFYFALSEELKVNFDVDYNVVTICSKRYDQDNPPENCQSVSPGDRTVFTYTNPCNDASVSRDCSPIYFTLEASDLPDRSGRYSCAVAPNGWPCRSPDSARVSVSHIGMTCSSSSILPSLSTTILNLIFLYLTVNFRHLWS